MGAQEAKPRHQLIEPTDFMSSSLKQSDILGVLRRNCFVLLTMAAVAMGISLGFALRLTTMTARDIKYFNFPGELLIRMLQMLVLPLIFSSVITGVSSVDRKASGKIGLRVFCYYVVTTVIAVFTGIILVVLIQPGHSSRNTSVSPGGHGEAVQTGDAFLDLIRNMFPSNLVEACFRKYKTVYSRGDLTPKHLAVVNQTESDVTVPMPGSSNGVNILGLLVFSLSFGLILGSMGARGKPLRDFFDCLNDAIMRLINIVIWYAPVGIFFLTAGQILEMTDIWVIGGQVAMYLLCVITGLLIHSILVLPLIYIVITRKNPFQFMGGLLQALTTACGTASSSATLPVTFHCLEKNHLMDKRVTTFMLPIGASMNMDGTALYEAVAALFIAQINNMDFDLGQIIVLCLIVTVASMGAAGIPQAGMVTMVLVLTSAGLPSKDIPLLLMVDWILDRLRTATNVLGDCIGVGVVQHLSRRELQSQVPAEESLI